MEAPTSEEVFAILKERGHRISYFSYTPGPLSHTLTAEEMADSVEASWESVDKERVCFSAVKSTYEECLEEIEDYVDNADYKTSIKYIEEGPKAGRWLVSVDHKSFWDM